MFRRSKFIRELTAAAVTTAAASTTSPIKPPGSNNDNSSSILKYPHTFIDQESSLISAAKALSTASSFSLDVEAFCTNTDQKHLGPISLLQFCSEKEPVVYILDVLTLGIPTVVKHIEPFMSNPAIKKYVFDCRRDVEALSTQMQLKPKSVLDLQLFHTAVQWKTRGTNRRSGLQFVLKSVLNVDRQEGDSAVTAAMTLGNRPVWDVRPLPSHFLEYAADDVRHILLLANKLVEDYPDKVDAVERLSALYVDHYGVGKNVETEADPAAHQVVIDWLERMLGPAGYCTFCGQKGHTEVDCFKKRSGSNMKCSHCGEAGHIASMCYKKHPQLLKCTHCGQLGHTAARCFAKNPCAHCGGQHPSASCQHKPN